MQNTIYMQHRSSPTSISLPCHGTHVSSMELYLLSTVSFMWPAFRNRILLKHTMKPKLTDMLCIYPCSSDEQSRVGVRIFVEPVNGKRILELITVILKQISPA